MEIDGGPIARNDVDAKVIHFDLMARVPLWVSPEFPTGRLQPYGFVGPAISIITTTAPAGLQGSDTSTGLGVSLGVGVSYHVTQTVAAFFEFRHNRLNWNPRIAGTQLDGELNSNLLLVGATYHFF